MHERGERNMAASEKGEVDVRESRRRQRYNKIAGSSALKYGYTITEFTLRDLLEVE